MVIHFKDSVSTGMPCVHHFLVGFCFRHFHGGPWKWRQHRTSKRWHKQGKLVDTFETDFSTNDSLMSVRCPKKLAVCFLVVSLFKGIFNFWTTKKTIQTASHQCALKSYVNYHDESKLRIQTTKQHLAYSYARSK